MLVIIITGIIASCDAQRITKKEKEKVLLCDETWYFGYGPKAPFKIVTYNDSIAEDLMRCGMWHRGYTKIKKDRYGSYVEYVFYFPSSYYYAMDIYFIKKEKLPLHYDTSLNKFHKSWTKP